MPEDNTEILTNNAVSVPQGILNQRVHESHMFNLSVRSILALMITGTACFCFIKGQKMDEQLAIVFASVISFYMGQQNKPKSQQ